METTDAGPVITERVPLGATGRFAALVALNRPECGNAIDELLLEALADAVAGAEAAEEVCVILICGRGTDFCAGLDPDAGARLRGDPLRYPRFLRRAQLVFESFRDAGKPVVGLVHGRAAGLGLELALWCDFLYCAESATFCGGTVTGGCGGAGALTLLPRLAGLAYAREMVFTGRTVQASEAYRHGIVNRVVADDRLIAAGLELAADTGRKFATAIAYAKNVINTGWHQGLGVDSALSLELERAARYAVTADG
jgi:enoyl-CoA hydratase/carnithine racemase